MTTITPITTPAQLAASHAIASQQYDHTPTDYITLIQTMISTEGYHLIGAYNGQALVGIAGYNIGHRLYCGKFLHLHNLIIDQKHRHQGLAIEIIDHLKALARAQNCQTLLADTYLENTPAQALFKHQNFQTRGNHLKHDLR